MYNTDKGAIALAAFMIAATAVYCVTEPDEPLQLASHPDNGYACTIQKNGTVGDCMPKNQIPEADLSVATWVPFPRNEMN